MVNNRSSLSLIRNPSSPIRNPSSSITNRWCSAIHDQRPGISESQDGRFGMRNPGFERRDSRSAMRDGRWQQSLILIAHPESLIAIRNPSSSITNRWCSAHDQRPRDQREIGMAIRDEESGIREKGFAISDEGWAMATIAHPSSLIRESLIAHPESLIPRSRIGLVLQRFHDQRPGISENSGWRFGMRNPGFERRDSRSAMRDGRWRQSLIPHRSSGIPHRGSGIPHPRSRIGNRWCSSDSRPAGLRTFKTAILDEESGIREKGFAIREEGWAMVNNRPPFSAIAPNPRSRIAGAQRAHACCGKADAVLDAKMLSISPAEADCRSWGGPTARRAPSGLRSTE